MRITPEEISNETVALNWVFAFLILAGILYAAKLLNDMME